MVEQTRQLASRRILREALARRAYGERRVRLACRDLGGCDHLVSTRRGLFAVGRDGHRLIAQGQFFGLTVEGNTVFAFEACDRPSASSRLGRIVRLRREGTEIVAAEVFVEGLDNGCHQIDLIGDILFVANTYRQHIVAIDRHGAAHDYRPIPLADARDWANGYAHINSLIASGEHRLVLLHNGAGHTGLCSEVAILDAGWRLIEKRPLAGSGCHGLAVLEDGTLLSCGSFAGEVVGSNGLRVKVTDLMTRGLSVGAEQIVVGGSAFAERDVRDRLMGEVCFLDRNYQLLGTVPMPAPPTEIRRIDGADLSLSNHVRRMGLAVGWPLSQSAGPC
jgi:hypothetical protein